MSGSKIAIEHRPAPLPPKSLRSPKLTNAKVAAEGRCRLCQRSFKIRQPTRHHLIPQSWWIRQPLPLRAFRNAWAGIVPLCRKCHDSVDSKDPVEQWEWRRMLRRSLTQQEIAFVICVMSKRWLDLEYPRQ